MALEEGEMVRKGALNSVGGQKEVCGAAVGARTGVCSCGLFCSVEIFVSEGLFHGHMAARQQVRACGHIGVLMRNLCPLRVSEQKERCVC